jgi:3-deoxy-D-manno-octulosonate 8-phosphate phosphatase (KDO 8-P phosphatase)
MRGDDMSEKLSLLVLDVDGVLTDGSVLLDASGKEFKAFCTQDGSALRMLMKAGFRVALISGRSCEAVEKRAEELGIEEVHQGVTDKLAVLSGLLEKFGLTLAQVAYMGDDIPDLPMIRQVGFSYAPANARPIVKDFAQYVTEARGGDGAVAEVCEKILRQNGLWDELLSQYL